MESRPSRRQHNPGTHKSQLAPSPQAALGKATAGQGG